MKITHGGRDDGPTEHMWQCIHDWSAGAHCLTLQGIDEEVEYFIHKSEAKKSGSSAQDTGTPSVESE